MAILLNLVKSCYPGEVWRWSSAEDRSIGLGMQYDTVGGRLWCWCTASQNCSEPSRDSHKSSYYSVGMSRRWIDHQSEHNQCLGLLSRVWYQPGCKSSSAASPARHRRKTSYDTQDLPTCIHIKLPIHSSKPWHFGIGTQRTTCNPSIEVILFPDFRSYISFDLWFDLDFDPISTT